MNHHLRLVKGNWAVIFISERREDPEGYAAMDDLTMKAVEEIPGFLGWEAARQSPVGVFISYWNDLEAVNTWRQDALHRKAKEAGKKQWYDAYRTVICHIEETHYFKR